VKDLSIDQATKRYEGNAVLNEVCIDVSAGEFVTLLGPSGCGKSTTLRAVAGLLDLDTGTIKIGGRDVTRVPIELRDIGLVFQNLALFPHMTVAKNIAFGLRMRGINVEQRTVRVKAALTMVRLADFGDRYPDQLSGGQQQRVAIARALVTNPSVLLLDEPFAALDRKLREEMQSELRQLTRSVGITSIFVTHDQEEALTLSDRIVVLNRGRVEQTGTPEEIYNQPRTRFCADFMGVRNVIEGETLQIDQTILTARAGTLDIAAVHDPRCWNPNGKTIEFAIRPEAIRLSPAADMTVAPNRIVGIVRSRNFQGAFASYEIGVDIRGPATLSARTSSFDRGTFTPDVGEQVVLQWKPDDLIILRSLPH
jgi:spermidine/putrescine ABC transporter ATP-binding subunit